MHRHVILACLLLLAACGLLFTSTSVVPSVTPAVPATDTPSATIPPTPTYTPIASEPPTLPPTIPPAAATTPASVIDTPLTPQPGLVIHGHVRLADGSGVPDVSICRNYASYPGTVVARTDANGFFESAFAFIPGDEMVGAWPLASGYAFQPDYYRWRHYYGVEDHALEFIAVPGAATAVAQFPCQ